MSADRPAQAGDVISLYASGLGSVNGALSTGAAAASPPLRLIQPLEVRIGGVAVEPDFAGLIPGFAGVYQMNARLPLGIPNGTVTVEVFAGEQSSPSSFLNIR